MSSPTYPAWVNVVQSQIAKGTSRQRASVCANSVFPAEVTEIIVIVTRSLPTRSTITVRHIVETTLTWACWAKKNYVALLKFNVSVVGVKDLSTPLLLRCLLASLLLHGHTQSVSMRTDPCNLQQLCKNTWSHGVRFMIRKKKKTPAEFSIQKKSNRHVAAATM